MSRRGAADGFSLVELMVAMVVTLIVTGAIYGLLSSGNSAFRREPELSDRQQNIRQAMDLISRDVIDAGAGMPAFSQSITITDPSGVALNGAGPLGSLGTDAAAARNADPSANSDILEVVGVEDECPTWSVCEIAAPVAAGTAGVVATRQELRGCLDPAALPRPVLQEDGTNFTVQWASAAAGTACTGGGPDNGTLALGNALLPWTPSPAALSLPNSFAPPVTPQVFIAPVRIARYKISTDPTDGAPGLWRSATGRFGSTGAVVVDPGIGGFPGAGSNWQMIARGVEDLQVEYQDGTGVWANAPPAIAAADFNTIVRQVRITLSARSLAPLLSGQTTQAVGGAGGAAVRGQLVTVVTPRASVTSLQVGNLVR